MTPLFGRRARLRWLHLIIGGALLMPYFLVGMVLVGASGGGDGVFSSLTGQFTAFAYALPMAAVTGLFPLVRPLSVAAARALCGIPAERLAEGPARSRQARVRAAGWYTLHLALGGVVSGMTLALTPFAVGVMGLPFSAALRDSALLGLPPALDRPWIVALTPLAGLALLSAPALCAAAAGELLARRAPVLLGPTPDDRLAAAERRAAALALRNRLARELHDSVGHALSAVTLQAGAARRVLADDPEFVREALAAIEETTRRTVGELDSMLGLLRQNDEPANGPDGVPQDQGPGPGQGLGPEQGLGRGPRQEPGPGPGLDALDGLLARCGVPVAYEALGEPGTVTGAVSGEAYRIVQEGLSNALRHGAGGAPVELRIAVREEELEITMENPLSGRPPALRPGGGRGLRGIAERAVLLGGRTEAGPHGGTWRLTARLPLDAAGRTER
ncbi:MULTISPECIES: sensor histidine kinase [unclassified Streptomyces]|uniref:sensor histidine kinase n=1 Tax=unclassified Streptomyces TaxID=2593676 RepID=UPI00093BE96A|nr:histidine kinase [Streptomyces sp. TSRI0281]OKI45586.1 histidine kinase [Streptomyces sp. TSRI0281]